MMARGRMISRTLLTSEKWRALSWPARALYSALMAQTDRDGCLTGEDRELWATSGAALICELPEFSGWIAEMVPGLFERITDRRGRPVLLAVRFRDYQTGEYVKEGPSAFDLADEVVQRPVVASRSRVGRDSLGESLGNKDKVSEASREEKGRETRPVALISTNGSPPRDDLRLGFAGWRLYRARIQKDEFLSAVDSAVFQEEAERGAFAPWKTAEEIADRFAFTFDRLDKLRDKAGRRYGTSPRALVRNLRREWDASPETRPEQAQIMLGPISVVKRQEELEEIRKAPHVDTAPFRAEFERMAGKAPRRPIAAGPVSDAGPQPERAAGPLAHTMAAICEGDPGGLEALERFRREKGR